MLTESENQTIAKALTPQGATNVIVESVCVKCISSFFDFCFLGDIYFVPKATPNMDHDDIAMLTIID